MIDDPWRALPDYVRTRAERCAVADGLSLREFVVRAIELACRRTEKRKPKNLELFQREK